MSTDFVSDPIVEFQFNKKTFSEFPENLELRNITPEHARAVLSSCSSKIAYWCSVSSDVRTALEFAEGKFELDRAKWYMASAEEYPRATDHYLRKNASIVDHADEYMRALKKIATYRRALKKAEGIVTSLIRYNDGLRSILSSLKSEMESID